MGEAMGNTLDAKLKILEREFANSYQHIADLAQACRQAPPLSYTDSVSFPHYVQGKIVVPCGFMNKIIPPDPESRDYGVQAPEYFRNGPKQGARVTRARPFSRAPVEERRSETVRFYRLAGLAGLPLYTEKCELYREFAKSRMITDREQSGTYRFFNCWARTWAGLVAVAHNGEHGKYANWVASWVRDSVKDALQSGPEGHEVCGYVGNDYAAQLFLEETNLGVRDARFVQALVTTDAVAIHRRVPRPCEEFGLILNTSPPP